VGWHIAPRVWPWAALIFVPSLLAVGLGAPGAFGKPGWITVVLYVIGALANAALTAAVLPSVLRWFADAREEPAVLLDDLRGRFAPVVGAALLSGLISLLLGAPFFLLMLVRPADVGGWLVVAMIVLFPIEIWISLRLMLIVAVAVIERCSAFTAARRSWSLTRGGVLTIIGVNLVLALAWFVPVFVVAFVTAFATGANPSSSSAMAWTSSAVGILMTPWYLAFAAVLYHDFRRRADHVDSRRIAEDAALA